MTKRKGGRNVPRVMYIYCEGEKTEPLYLESYISENSRRTLSVFKIPKTRKNTPEQLVDEAIKKKNSSSTADGDEFWVVYDQEHLTTQSVLCHQRAWNKANRHGINIAISCVCFELWLLLHFGYTTRSFSSYENLMSASPFKSLLPNYNKGSSSTYDVLKNRIGKARKNAAQLEIFVKSDNENIHEPYKFPCYTSFHKLLDAIDNF
ncbi:TPA: RloB family protein [Escherichia coli]